MALPKDQKFPIPAGTKVKIRTWEDMEKEYGLSSLESIDVPCGFTEKMRPLAGSIITLTKDMHDWGFMFAIDHNGWYISAEMIDYVLPRCAKWVGAITSERFAPGMKEMTMDYRVEPKTILLDEFYKPKPKGGTMNPIIAEIFKNDKTSDAMLVNKHFGVIGGSVPKELWTILLTPHKDELLKAAKEMEEEEKKNA